MKHMGRRGDGQKLQFKAVLNEVASSAIVRVPGNVSERLPSRGQVAVEGTLNGHEFTTVVEPDGAKGHWIRVDEELRRTAGLNVGEPADITVAVRPEWPEPEVPADLAHALAGALQEIRDMWDDITPMARWEWVRWVNATASGATRKRRVEVTISKMASGKRRPCCFDLSACTDPALSKNGKLLGTG